MQQMYESQSGMSYPEVVQFFKLLGTCGGPGCSFRPDFGLYVIFVVWESFVISRKSIHS